ncbi:hypothetical protein GGD65_000569 [Bradyrhizobium sp. CIR18]|nr:hypothetical protein [Bradyrhizobium sp. CIR18]MBB4359571.1 hypothetical protein [Bradyrhizobium sp. CIR18]
MVASSLAARPNSAPANGASGRHSLKSRDPDQTRIPDDIAS